MAGDQEIKFGAQPGFPQQLCPVKTRVISSAEEALAWRINLPRQRLQIDFLVLHFLVSSVTTVLQRPTLLDVQPIQKIIVTLL